MKKTIVTIPGDGIGPEIVAEAVKILRTVASRFGHEFEFVPVLAGGSAIDATGVPLPRESLDACKAADAVLLGAVGGPKWDNLQPADLRPERGALLALRGGLGLFCNLRPSVLQPQLKGSCPLRADLIGDGLDIMVVRELTGGIYFGEHRRSEDGQSAWDVMKYSVPEIERIARKAFEVARRRRHKVTSLDKHNILETSRLWRETVTRIAADYPDVALNHLYVDNASMQLIRDPRQFDVILTENTFGDILSDEASMLAGSLGMLPSASLREDAFGLYEPVHGSAPDIAGRGVANPIATILSAGMMLRYSFGLQTEADAVDRAVSQVLDAGYRTGDIMTDGGLLVGTSEMGSRIAEALIP